MIEQEYYSLSDLYQEEEEEEEDQLFSMCSSSNTHQDYASYSSPDTHLYCHEQDVFLNKY